MFMILRIGALDGGAERNDPPMPIKCMTTELMMPVVDGALVLDGFSVTGKPE